MPTPDVPFTWRVVMHQTMGGLQLENVFHVQAPLDADPQAVADDAGHAWTVGGSWQAVQTSEVSYGLIDVQPYDGASAVTECSVLSYSTQQGDIGEAPAPIQCCGLVTLRSGTAGRSGRGRMYVSGIRNDYVVPDGTRWDLSIGSFALQDAADSWRLDLGAGGVTTSLMVYSPTTDSSLPITSTVFRPYFGTQRRRSERAE